MSSNAAYLIRFDDICPTMNWSVWRRIEAIMIGEGIRPILAVVPDNRDPELDIEESRPEFWCKVREWQALGWTIGLHGYQHRYVTKDPGIMRLNRRSEFAGLPFSEQKEKIVKGLDIFRANGVTADLWIAPSHSFDRATLQALTEAGVDTVSDGFFLYPHTDRSGLKWLPQQLWDFRPVPFGTWTVCLHCNDWDDVRLNKFRRDIATYRKQISSAQLVLGEYARRKRSTADTLFSTLFPAYRFIRSVTRQFAG